VLNSGKGLFRRCRGGGRGRRLAALVAEPRARGGRRASSGPSPARYSGPTPATSGRPTPASASSRSSGSTSSSIDHRFAA